MAHFIWLTSFGSLHLAHFYRFALLSFIKIHLNAPNLAPSSLRSAQASYTLNNFLPSTRRLSAIDNSYNSNNSYNTDPSNQMSSTNAKMLNDCITDSCASGNVTLSDIDGVRIPAALLTKAKGIAVMTVAKAGCWVGGEFGTGLVVVRTEEPESESKSKSKSSPGYGWSAPSAIGMFGFSIGPLIGAQLVDHVFLLMTDRAVELLGTPTGSINLGGDISLAVGPVGRSIEGSIGATVDETLTTSVAGIYTYSFTKGLYAGVSLDGKVIATRHDVNEKFYGGETDPFEILSGEIERPRAAQPLYDALKRCQVYAENDIKCRAGGMVGGVGNRGGNSNSNSESGGNSNSDSNSNSNSDTNTNDSSTNERKINEKFGHKIFSPPSVGPGGNSNSFNNTKIFNSNNSKPASEPVNPFSEDNSQRIINNDFKCDIDDVYAGDKSNRNNQNVEPEAPVQVQKTPPPTPPEDWPF